MNEHLHTAMARYRWWTILPLAATALWMGGRVRSLPAVSAEAPAAVAAPEWPSDYPPASGGWDRFRPAGASAAPSGPLASRFRLAGTFFSFAAPDGHSPRQRKAIVDDLEADRQHLVSEGDVLGEVEIRRIFQDRIILHFQGRDEELWLSFSEKTAPAPAAATTPALSPVRLEDMPALETFRFGKRIGENRWVLQRGELLTYYQELMDDPQRLAGLFLSMQPVPDPDDAAGTGGFALSPQGEESFFAALGMKEGDVITHVNSMRMVSERRGEYLFREFFDNRLNAFVFDVEREGRKEKLIYLIR